MEALVYLILVLAAVLAGAYALPFVATVVLAMGGFATLIACLAGC